MPPVAAAMRSPRECLICSSRTKYLYLGVDACRACGEFFRRVATGGKQYVCRQGKGNCDVTKSAQYQCRSCRYAKCVEVGMTLGTNGRASNSSRDASPSTTATPNDITQRDASCSVSADETKQEFPSTSVAWSTPPCDLPLLTRIQQSYRVMCSVRRASELANISPLISPKALFGCQTSSLPYTPVTYSQMNAAHRIATIALYEFADTVFEGFRDLPGDDKLNIIRGCYYPAFFCESFRRTGEEFPNDPGVFIVSYTHYLRKDELDSFYVDAPSEGCRQEAKQVMLKTIADLTRLLLPPFIDAAMDETEFFGFLALCIWCTPAANADRLLSDQANSMAEFYRERIFNELSLYYKKQLGLKDHGVKLCKIMCLLSTFQELSYTIISEMELYRLLDMVTDDTFAYQFHLRR